MTRCPRSSCAGDLVEVELGDPRDPHTFPWCERCQTIWPTADLGAIHDIPPAVDEFPRSSQDRHDQEIDHAR